MKKATIQLFKLGRIFGFTPFTISNEKLNFKKCSFQTVYFILVLIFSLLWTLLYLYVFITRLIRSSTSVALAFACWVSGSVSMTLTFLTYWIYKHEVINQVTVLFSWWDQIHDCIYKRRSGKYAKIIIIIWIITALQAMVSMTTLQLEHPGAVGFMSSHFAYSNNTIPNWIHYTSVGLHLFMLVYYFFSTLIGDVIPILFCLAYKVSFDRLAELLVQRVNKVQNSIKQENTDSTECMKCIEKIRMQTLIRSEVEFIMKVHRRVQNCLQLFNNSFAPMIVLFTCQMIGMCITWFYVCCVSHVSSMERYFYLSAGLSFLVRATVGFYYFGSIAGK